MDRPAASLAEPPAPRIVRPATKVSLQDVERMAKTSVVADFTRQMAFDFKRRQVTSMGGDTAQLIATDDVSSDYVKAQTNRFVKEQQSAHWAASLRSFSLNSLFIVAGITTSLCLYYGVKYKPIILTGVPMFGAMMFEAWALLEISWENQRFAKQAAMVRSRRIGNPLHAVPVQPSRIIEDDSIMN